MKEERIVRLIWLILLLIFLLACWQVIVLLGNGEKWVLYLSSLSF